ncbi:DUF1453 family protein [Candidatus Acetothermia bacterium]|nr:DUF1453 family protein [Candidatus Acetothermia bacterium]
MVLNIIFLAVLAIIVLLVLSQLRESRMSVSRMWIIPALMIFLSYGSLTKLPFNSLFNIAILMAALGVGIALGVVREAFKKISVDKAAGEIIVKGTPIGVLIWIGAIVFERYVQDFLKQSKGIVTPQLLPAALLLLSLSAVIARRAYLYRKYRRAET